MSETRGRGGWSAAFVVAVMLWAGPALVLPAGTVLVLWAGTAQAQTAPVGDSQTTVHGYVQPTTPGAPGAPVQGPGGSPIQGDQGPPVEGTVQSTAPGYVDTPTAVQESVKGRGRPEFDPIGVPLNDVANGLGRLAIGRDRVLPAKTDAFLGSFVANTRMEAQASHDSNLYRTQTGTIADDLLVFRPSLTVGSDWANDELKFDMSGEIGRYRRTGSEDYQDYSLGVSGRLDVVEAESLSASLRFDHLHVQRGSPDDPGSPVPTLYNTTTLDLGHRLDGGTLFSRAKAQARYFDYLHNGGIENDDRDRAEVTLSERLGIEYVPGTQAWIEPGANTRRYVRGDFNGVTDRSSSGGQVLAGMTWDYSGITYFEFGAGYLTQSYDSPQFTTIKGPAVNGKAVWNATELLTISGNVGRRVNETVAVGESGYLATTYGLSADWEALYNLIADVSYRRETDDYRGGLVRNDTLNGWSTGLRYLFGRHWYAEARYFYDDRSSTNRTNDYTDQRFLLTLGEQL